MQKVLITGASGGLGSALVSEFSRTCAVTAGYFKNPLKPDKNVIPVYLDVRNEKSIISALGNDPEFDIVINNAGISLVNLFQNCSEKQISDVLDTNLLGSVLVSKICLPYMIRNKKGAIVNISSVWGIEGASCEAVYSASKAGLIGFTLALAKEVGPSGITVNSVAPGMLDTKMNSVFSEFEKKEFSEKTVRGKNPTCVETAEVVRLISMTPSLSGQIISV